MEFRSFLCSVEPPYHHFWSNLQDIPRFSVPPPTCPIRFFASPITETRRRLELESAFHSATPCHSREMDRNCWHPCEILSECVTCTVQTNHGHDDLREQENAVKMQKKNETVEDKLRQLTPCFTVIYLRNLSKSIIRVCVHVHCPKMLTRNVYQLFGGCNLSLKKSDSNTIVTILTILLK